MNKQEDEPGMPHREQLSPSQKKFVEENIVARGNVAHCYWCDFNYAYHISSIYTSHAIDMINQHLDKCPKELVDKPNLRQEILDKAAKCVNIDRRQNYGPPESNFKRIAQIWNVILGAPVTSAQVAQCMIAVKLARLIETPDHEDSWIDIAGYAACGGEIGLTSEDRSNQ